MSNANSRRIRAQQRWEKNFFERFAMARPELELKLVGQLLPPAPDILAQSLGRDVGIEVTEPPNGAFELLAHQYSVGDTAQAILRRGGGPPGFFRVIFNDREWSGPISRQKRARELADIIRSQMLGSRVGPEMTDLEPTAKWIEELSCLPYSHADARTDVAVSTSGWWVPMTIDAIQEILQKKEPKVPGYRKTASEIWLLIACQNGRPGWFALPGPVTEVNYVSRFDRVFFLSSMSDPCRELKLEGNP
jgi:hypothetical protein